MTRLSIALLLIFGFSASGFGCAAPRDAAPVLLTIAPGEYGLAFDAANEVARSYGLLPSLRDRRAGIIETQPVIAGSILEPWNRTTRTVDQAVENTLLYQRHRARFEFQAVRFLGGEASPDAMDTSLTGPDLLAQDRVPVDMTSVQDQIELRVWVYNEQAHVPGIRRSAWSRRMTSRTQIIDPETGEEDGGSWTVVSRNRELESHLLSEVERLMGAMNASILIIEDANGAQEGQ